MLFAQYFCFFFFFFFPAVTLQLSMEYKVKHIEKKNFKSFSFFFQWALLHKVSNLNNAENEVQWRELMIKSLFITN